MRSKITLELDVTVTESENDSGDKVVHVDFSHPELTGDLGFWCPSKVWAEKMIESIHSQSPTNPLTDVISSVISLKGSVKEVISVVRG